jgi:tetratricopeptide (TPR) repeat protein
MLTRRHVIFAAMICWLGAASAATVSKSTYDVLSAARKSIDAGSPAAAISDLDNLLSATKDNAYEHALALQMLGYAQAGAKDLRAAAASFQSALDSGQLPANDARDLRYNLAQILINLGQYKEGLSFLEETMKSGRLTRDVHALAAVAYQKTDNCKAAIPHLEALAGSKNEDADKWSQALVACQAQAGQFGELAATLEQAVRANPDDLQSWLQLAAAYQRAKKFDRAIATFEVLHARAQLDAAQLTDLARLYVTGGVPLKAADLLRREMDAGHLARDREHQQLLVDSLLLAHEDEAAATVLGDMLKQKEEGELWLQLGRIQFNRQQWQDAADSLHKAVDSRAIKDVSGANLLLGIAAMQTNQLQMAEQSLRIAAGASGTREQANWWLQRLRRQQEPPADSSLPAQG